MKKIPVYLMPGLSAGKKIFTYLKLPDIYEIHYMHWLIPYKNESLQDYSRRLATQITDENPILLGVSFGGIIIQEIAQQIPVKQLIIVSSIKHHSELKPFYKWAYKTKLYKLVPVPIIKKRHWLQKLFLPKPIKKKLRLYERFLEIDDTYYIRWSFHQVLSWRQTQMPENFVHIVGENDTVFPPKYINDPKIVVPRGRHEMMVYEVKWFNRHLPQLLAK